MEVKSSVRVNGPKDINDGVEHRLTRKKVLVSIVSLGVSRRSLCPDSASYLITKFRLPPIFVHERRHRPILGYSIRRVLRDLDLGVGVKRKDKTENK